ncbi:MAG: UbiA family prenyltransferase [Phycisphaerae bacterium]|nr:UbiA family prenyltransferase [Phycisphaerae bacterium]
MSRLPLVFTAIANIWLVTLLSRSAALGDGTWPHWTILALTAAVATGLYVFGMTLNDVLDSRHDRTFAPARPIPSGRISPGAALALGIAALLLALAATLPLGRTSTLTALICAALILLYDAAGKHVPALGLLLLGIIRAVHMLIADPSLAFCWPVWLTLSHVVALSTICYRLEDKRPALSPRAGWLVLGSWAFMTMGMVAWMSHVDGLWFPRAPWIWLAPTAAALLFLAFAARLLHRAKAARSAGGGLMKLGLLWLIVYDAAWLLGAGLWTQAAVVGALLPLAWSAMWGVHHLRAAATAVTGFEREG